MRTELPVCKRCCLCLPLRYGLLGWGYFRLAYSIFMMIGMSIAFFEMLGMSDKTEDVLRVVVLGIVLTITMADIVLNIVFVVGGHKKDPKLFKAYYIYSIILWILLILLGIAYISYTIYMTNLYELDVLHSFIMVVDIASFLAQILIQAYVILLVRSEIVKLTNNGEFRFVNNAAESQCKMKYAEEVIVDAEKGAKDMHQNGNVKPSVNV